MTRPEERWLQGELPDDLRRVLQSADVDEPSSVQLDQLRAKLGVALGPAFASPPAPHEAAVSHGYRFLSLGKSLGLISVFVLGFGAAWWGSPKAAPPPPTAASIAQPPAVVAVEPEPEPAPAPAVAAAPTPPAAAVSVARHERPRPPGLGEELRQLENIRRWLARSPRRALAAADEHQRRFPRGALGPERELLRIDALLRLGQYDRARQRADRVLAAPEGHPYRAQVAALLSEYRGAAAAPIKPAHDE